MIWGDLRDGLHCTPDKSRDQAKHLGAGSLLGRGDPVGEAWFWRRRGGAAQERTETTNLKESGLDLY